MNIADGMRNITENIIASHQVRVRALGNLVKEVSETIRSNAADRKAMSKEQGAELARFAHDLASSVSEKLDLMCKDRTLSAKELKSRLKKEARDLKNMVKKMMNDYRKDHAEMSEELWHNLHGYVNDIVRTVGDLLGGYRADMRKAGNIWGDMTRTLAKKRGVLPVIRAEEEVGTVKEAVRKIQKRKKRKK